MGTFHNIKSSYDRLVSLKAISKPVVMALSKEGICAHHLKLAVKRNKNVGVKSILRENKLSLKHAHKIVEAFSGEE